MEKHFKSLLPPAPDLRYRFRYLRQKQPTRLFSNASFSLMTLPDALSAFGDISKGEQFMTLDPKDPALGDRSSFLSGGCWFRGLNPASDTPPVADSFPTLPLILHNSIT
jgi:hypothetical protein